MASFIAGVCFTLLFVTLFGGFESKYLFAACLLSISIWIFRYRRSRKSWRYHCDGTVAPGFEKVLQTYRESILSRQEQGSSFAVYYQGKLVVDLWGGYADHQALRLRSQDSVSMVYSVSKCVTAVCMAMLVDRGLLDYKAPVSKYWPEFAQEDKDRITVETLLCHRAGLITISEKHTLSLLRDDPEKLAELLAKQKPFWTPGTAQGYHMLTYGLYADMLLRRVDERGRSLSQFFQEEVATPFNIDFFIGAPKAIHHRSCRENRAQFGLRFFFTTTIPTGFLFIRRVIYSLFKYRTLYIAKFIGNPTDWNPRRLNDPDFRGIGCGSSHGVGTPRALAKLMGILANGGKLDGQTLLTSEAIERLGTPLSAEFDRVILRDIKYGPGTTVKELEPNNGLSRRRVFGHWGAGGQVLYCDPAHRLAWCYATNYSNLLHGFIMDHRYSALESAMYQCVADMVKSK